MWAVVSIIPRPYALPQNVSSFQRTFTVLERLLFMYNKVGRPNILKSVSWNQLMKEMPEMKELLWGGVLWSSGYFVRATGDMVTSDIIKRYILYQHEHDEGPKQRRFQF